MGIKDFAISMLKRDIKQFKLYIVSIVISIAVVFNLFNLLYNGQFTAMGDISFMFNSMITFMTIAIAIMFVFFTNRYFLIKKTKEIGISLISGRNVYEIGSMIEIQNCIILGIGLALGVIFGILTMPLFLFIMYSALGVTGSYFSLSLEGLYYTAAVIIMEFIWIILINFGYIYRQEVKDLLVNEQRMYEPDRRKFKFKPWVYLLVYILPIFILGILLFQNISKNDFSQFTNIIIIQAAFGLLGMFQYYIPFKFHEVKSKKFIRDRYKLLAFSNLEYSLRKAALIILAFGMTSITLISFLCNGLTQGLEKLIPAKTLEIIAAKTNSLTIISYVLILLLISITLIYKVAIEAENRKRNFKQYLILGYTKLEILKVASLEMKYFYGLITFTPLLYIGVMVASQVYAEVISLNLASFIVGSYLLIMLLTYVTSNYIYRRIVLNYIERG